MPLASKLGFFFKSPMTNGYGESYVGGSIPRYPKWVGYDAVIFTGKSPDPTYIVISEDDVMFMNADHLWGKTTIETDDILRKEYGNAISVACIGPAGENKVRFACICVDKWRQAGRCGGGAVMGAKNLKAIVFMGGKMCEPSLSEKFNELIVELRDRLAKSKGVKRMREYGTPSMAALANEMGFFPTRYWKDGSLERWEDIGPERIKSILIHPKSCWNCPIACGRYVSIQTKWGKIEMDGPEYETIYAIGGLFCINNLDDLVYLNYLADAYGLDTISLGNTLGLATEAYKMHKIDFSIKYGDTESAAELIKLIAYRRGVGNIFAEGTMRASRMLGMEDIAIHVKGLEPAGYDPRILWGMSIAYSTSPRGACHLRTMAYIIDIRRISGDPSMLSEEKVLTIVDYELWMTSFDCLIMCKFGRDVLDIDFMLDIFNAATGFNMSKSEYISSLRSVIKLTRYFNQREGIDRKSEVLPQRFFKEPIRKNNEEYLLDKSAYERALAKYYELLGLDHDGRINREDERKLKELLGEKLIIDG